MEVFIFLFGCCLLTPFVAGDDLLPSELRVDGYTHRIGDCVGSDITKITKTTVAECARECNALENCKSFLYNSRWYAGNYCWLKNSACPRLTWEASTNYHFYTKTDEVQVVNATETIYSVSDCLSSGNCWVRYNFSAPSTWNDCAGGAKYVKKTSYSGGRFLGVELCSPTKYKLFLSNDLTSEYKHIADGSGFGDDHCEFMGGERDDSRASREGTAHAPKAIGFRRSHWGDLVGYGKIGRANGFWYYPKSYTCGVTVPGSARVIEYSSSPGETFVTSTITPTTTVVSSDTTSTTEQLQVVNATETSYSVSDCLSSGNCWVRYNFSAPSTWNDCAGGAKYVRKTNYSEGRFLGVELCSPTKYKLFLSNDLTSEYKHIADGDGIGEDHCEFIGGEAENARASKEGAKYAPSAMGFRRHKWGGALIYGKIGRANGFYYYPKSYTCGVTVPGSDRVIEYSSSPGETFVTSTITPTTTVVSTDTTSTTEQLQVVNATETSYSVSDCLSSGNCWVRYNFSAPSTWNDCAGGAKYVRKTNYSEGRFLGVELCSPTKYKLFLSNDLTSEYKHIADGDGIGEDHCEFIGGEAENARASKEGAKYAPSAMGFRRHKWGGALIYGKIGRANGFYYYPKSYTCGVTVPGSDRVIEYSSSPGETFATSTITPTTTVVSTDTTSTTEQLQVVNATETSYSVSDCLSSGNCWVRYNFSAPSTWNDCAGGAKYVRKTNYSEGRFLGVELCSPTKYKLFLSNDLTSEYKHIADGSGIGSDHCEFMGGEWNNARASKEGAENAPSAMGFYRSNRGRALIYGKIGRANGHRYYPKSYTCGVTVPGSARVIEYSSSPGETFVTSTITPTTTVVSSDTTSTTEQLQVVNATTETSYSVSDCLSSGNCWVRYNFSAPSTWNDCAGGAKYVRKTNYSEGRFLGVELCSPTKYKLFLSNDLTSEYKHIADGAGIGDDHCEFMGGEAENARASKEGAEYAPSAMGFHRSSWGRALIYGKIGRANGHWYYPKSYTCGVTVPGSDRVIEYSSSPGETFVTSTITPTTTVVSSDTTSTTEQLQVVNATTETSYSVSDCLSSGNCWVRYNFSAPSTWNDCAGGAKYVRKTNYSEGRFLGVELCSPTKYKLFLSNDLTSEYKHIADGAGIGDDHCEFIGGEAENARASKEGAEYAPSAMGFHRSSWGRALIYGKIGRANGHWYYPKSYTCGVTVPGSDRVIEYSSSPGETFVTSTITPTTTVVSSDTTSTTEQLQVVNATETSYSVSDCLSSGNCWVRYNFSAPSTWNDCAGGAKYVRKTNYSEGRFLGVELCSPTKYKLFLSNDLTSEYKHIADGAGIGDDHCEFMGGEAENARASKEGAEYAPSAMGFRRSSWGFALKYGKIGRANGHWYYPKSYTCGVTVPGSDRVIEYSSSPGETFVTSTITPTTTVVSSDTTSATEQVQVVNATETSYSVSDCLSSGNCWVRYNFSAPSTWNDCAGGAKYVRKTNYSEGRFLGVELCSPTKYKLFLSNDLTSEYKHIADGAGIGDDHCEFIGGEAENARASKEGAENAPSAMGFRRSSWGQAPVSGQIGRANGHWYYPKSYICGVTVPGSARVIEYSSSPGETFVTSTITPTTTMVSDTTSTTDTRRTTEKIRIFSVAARITLAPRDHKVKDGGAVSFVCQASGSPVPDIEWLKNGKRVPTRGRYKVLDMPFGSVLRIEPVEVEFEKYNATISCVAQSGIGEPARVSANLQVYPPGRVPSGFPTITQNPSLRAVEKGRTSVMSCAATGNPAPTITWLKDFIPVELSNPRLTLLSSGSLQIEKSNHTDEGRYECVAENSVGETYSYPASLYVRVRRVPPHITSLPKSIEVLPGGSVNLTCVAAGSPKPYVKWRRADEELTPEENVQMGENVLMLTNVRESANYTCDVANILGAISAVAEVKVKAIVPGVELPEALASCSMKKVGSAALREIGMDVTSMGSEGLCGDKCRENVMCDSATFNKDKNECLLHLRQGFAMPRLARNSCCTTYMKVCPLIKSPVPPPKEQILCPLDLGNSKPSDKYAYRVLRLKNNFERGLYSCRTDELCAGISFEIQSGNRVDFTYYYNTTSEPGASFFNSARQAIKNCRTSGPTCRHLKAVFGMTLTNITQYRKKTAVETKAGCVASCERDQGVCSAATFRWRDKECLLYHFPEDYEYQLAPSDLMVSTWIEDPSLCSVRRGGEYD
ncbi:uncharacterized protein LOC135490709 isoform X1 [Lineus longissimus]|uniref:uncharacterized protein LOC135490709 isoform X1 n=1 Tax=Lineus longissimus TaxID=88925 RepID=UPI00315D8D46